MGGREGGKEGSYPRQDVFEQGQPAPHTISSSVQEGAEEDTRQHHARGEGQRDQEGVAPTRVL